MISIKIMLTQITINPLVNSVIMFIIGVGVFCLASWFLSRLGDRSQFYSSRGFLLIIIGSSIPSALFLLFIFLRSPLIFGKQSIFWISSGLGVLICVCFLIKGIYGQYLSLPIKYEPISISPNHALLDIQNLKIYYPIYGGWFRKIISYVKAVDNLSFQLFGQETLAIVGESGCGKSTIAEAILGFVPLKEGTITFAGKPLTGTYSREIRHNIQIVFQDPDSSLNPQMKVVDIITEPLKNISGILDRLELRNQALELLEDVSLRQEHLDRFPHEFSGGQKQRIIIARAIACKPKLIILDEPTSALDVSVQAQILNLLKDLQQKYHLSFLFITHNLAVVHHIASRVAVMYLGKFVEIGPVDRIFSSPQHPYTQALLAARSEIDPDHKRERVILEGEVPSPIDPPKGCRFHPRCTSPLKNQWCSINEPTIQEIVPEHIRWCPSSDSKEKKSNDK